MDVTDDGELGIHSYFILVDELLDGGLVASEVMRSRHINDSNRKTGPVTCLQRRGERGARRKDC